MHTLLCRVCALRAHTHARQAKEQRLAAFYAGRDEGVPEGFRGGEEEWRDSSGARACGLFGASALGASLVTAW
jgi:hypothetical protein